MTKTRKIKFRAWDKRLKTWLFEDQFHIFPQTGFEAWYYEPDCGTRNEEDIILMQYIGLKDKNGKEIYEGDICKVNHSEENYIIKWIGIGFWFECQVRKECFVFTPENYWIEVIGNVYKNSELLEKTND